MTSFAPGRQIAAQCASGDILRSVDQVFAEIMVSVDPIEGTETVPAELADGRVLASDITAETGLPRFDNSAVDGYGIGLHPLGAPLTVSGGIDAGQAPGPSLPEAKAVRLRTGAPIPNGVQTVIAEESCRVEGGQLRFIGTPARGLNIRRAGEDVLPGSILAQAGTVLDARHAALLAAVGRGAVEVGRRVRVGLLSTGSELVNGREHPQPGQIYDSNRPMLAALLKRPWLEATDRGILPDDTAIIARAISAASERDDILLCSGGVFGSDRDCIGPAIAAASGTYRHHRIAMKPGKSLVLGIVNRMTVLALPGNPLAALIAFLVFGRPLLARLAGIAAGDPATQRPRGEPGRAAAPIVHSIGRREFALGRVVGRTADGRRLVEGMGKGGSAHLLPLALADGFLEIPPESGDVQAGDPVAFHDFAAVLS